MIDQFVSHVFERYVPGTDFIDIGPLYGTINERLTEAKRCGAKSLAAADIDRLDQPSWKRLREHLEKTGVSEYREFQANIDDPDVLNKLGTYDFVYSAGILYHVPSPLYTLERYRSLTRRHFLLGSMVVPDVIENDAGRLEFGHGQLVFVPAIDDATRPILARHFDSIGLSIMHINAQTSWPWRTNDKINYGPWWWLYSASTLATMLKASGFRILESESTWQGRHHYYLCEKDYSTVNSTQ